MDSCGASQALSGHEPSAHSLDQAGYIAINTIHCLPHYVERFECLFCSRAKMIDQEPGFLGMKVLKGTEAGAPYLVLSYWESEAAFVGWTQSPAFLEGHRRAFADLAEAKARGEEPPMRSDFKTYTILTR